MNWPHIHLMINHFPVIGLFLSLVLLVYAIYKRNRDVTQTALGAFVLIAVLAIPVYLTGQAAEDLVKRLPGATEGLIGAHEEVADLALVLILCVGTVALGGLLYFRRMPGIPGWFLLVVLVLAAAASGVVGLTANLGGRIRHPEAREGFVYPQQAAPDRTVGNGKN